MKTNPTPHRSRAYGFATLHDMHPPACLPACPPHARRTHHPPRAPRPSIPALHPGPPSRPSIPALHPGPPRPAPARPARRTNAPRPKNSHDVAT